MSGAKPLRRIFPKDVSGVVQDPSDQCKILWDDLVGSPTFHKISRFKISVLLHVLHWYAKTVRGSRGHVCAAPAVQNLTFTSHSLPHGLTHLRCGTPGETTITSSRPTLPVTPHRDHALSRKILTPKLFTYTDFSSTHFSPTDFSQTDFNIPKISTMYTYDHHFCVSTCSVLITNSLASQSAQKASTF